MFRTLIETVVLVAALATGGRAQVTGGSTFNSANINNMLFVDGIGYTNCAAALTAAGVVNNTIIVIPSSYAGAECPPTVNANITFWDFRGGAHTLVNNSVSWNQLSGSGLHSMSRFIQTRNSPTNSEQVVYGQAFYGGSFPASQVLGAVTGEVDTTGALTGVGAGSSLQALQANVILNSTGQTIQSAYGGVFGVASTGANTTNVQNIYTIRAVAYAKGGTETVTNAYGVLIDQQTNGSTRNYGWYSVGGRNLLGFNTGGSAIDAEDSGHVARPFIYINNVNDAVIQAINNAGVYLQDFGGVNRFGCGVGGAPNCTISSGLAADGGGFKHKRVAGCATGAAQFNSCDTTVTWTTGFADLNYTATCTGDVVTSGVPQVEGIDISAAKATGSITVRTIALTAVTAQFSTIDCIAVHD